MTQPVPFAWLPAKRARSQAIASPAVPPPGPGTIPRLRGPRPFVVPSLFETIPSLVDTPVGVARSAAGPAPGAPALSASFVGLVDDGTVIPPDTVGAVGPDHLVSFLNSEVGFFEKTGTLLNPGTSLRDFWLPLISGNNLPDDPSRPKVFDPKVIFDTGSGRFVAVTLDGRLPTDNSSWVLLAVSLGSDPTLGWNAWALPADNTGVTWADFPGLGVDDNNVFITANLFDAGDNFRNSKIFRVPKTQLLSLPQTPTLERTEFTDPGFTLQPAHSLGTATSEYFVAEAGFVIGARRFLEILAVTGAPPALISLGTVEVSPYPAAALPVGPQTQIDTGDTRILNAVQRNGRVYATHTVSNATNTITEVAWYEIVPSSPPVLAQQGRVSAPTRFYYYPSIAVNANSDIALGFSGSSATEFPGGYYTARLNSDPLGTTRPVALLKAGLAPYFKTFGGTSNRWGDYSATVVDPTDNLTFWTLQEYARTATGWGTWWGSFLLPPPSAPSDPVGLSGTPLSGSTVQLSWTDASSNETGFVIERKTGTDPFSPVATAAANATTYTDGSLAERTTYVYRVKARNSVGDSGYSNEAAATTLLATPASAVAVAASSTRVDISWTDASALETGYRVERKTGAGGTFVAIAALPVNSVAFPDDSASAETSYSYRVQAVDNVTPTQSTYSNEAFVTTPAVPAAGGGGGGGCLSITRSGSGPPHTASLVSVGILLLPACALGLRRVFRRQVRNVPIRHPLC